MPGLTTSGRKLSSSMSKDSNHSLLHWTSPVGSLLVPSFLGPPSANPVHPPSSTAPTSDTLGPINILALQYSVSSLTGKQSIWSLCSSTLWRIIPSSHWFPGSSFPAHVTTL
ncbi:hypothetical protein AMECASPLE_036150 [Ameca splendens]|uniref:Uncharacterized protein n=1 Tax=Ameca splendens TaxID=208324 RepID=A0ABV0XWJ9_9TELE